MGKNFLRKNRIAKKQVYGSGNNCEIYLLTSNKNDDNILCNLNKGGFYMPNNRMKDLTWGVPMKLILSFMLPMLLGMLFQQFYGMVDTVVVGKILGVKALAGVGSTGSIQFLVLGLCNGMCAGFAIPVAQKFGQKDFAGLRKFVGNMIWLTAAVAVVMTLITTVYCRDILVWMKNPADTFDYAYNYLFLIFLGIPATMLYNLLSGIIRSLGDSRTPLYFLVFSSVLNVLLDLLFIAALKMGVAGAGWATLISQLVSGILCLMYAVAQFPVLRLTREDLRLEKYSVCHLLSMGLPMGMQYSITAVGSILLQTSVNSLGAAAMAAMTAGGRVGMFAVCPFDALGSTAATFAGQNIGAGKPDRVREGVKDASILGVSYSIVILAVLAVFGGRMTQLFLDPNDVGNITQIIPMSRRYLLCNACFYVALLYVNVLRFTIQGLGYSRLAVVAGVLEMVARGLFGICLVPLLGFGAVCFANPAAWILADLFLYPAYERCVREKGAASAKMSSAPIRKKA